MKEHYTASISKLHATDRNRVEDWNERRLKEIRQNSQDGATNRCISSAGIIRESEITF